MDLNKFIESINTNGGATLSFGSGILNPKFGYFASFKSSECKVKLSELNDSGSVLKAHISLFVYTHQKHLRKSGFFLGAWKTDEFIYLDISKQFSYEQECKDFAELNNQQAYYNANKGEVIQIN